MMAPAGKERTIEDFRKVLDDAGLQLTGVFQCEDDNFGLVEARLKLADPALERQSETTSSGEASPIEGERHQVSSLSLDFVEPKSEPGLTIIQVDDQY